MVFLGSRMLPLLHRHRLFLERDARERNLRSESLSYCNSPAQGLHVIFYILPSLGLIDGLGEGKKTSLAHQAGQINSKGVM
jgi:hypothetical protein